jgi:hypothetical protein
MPRVETKNNMDQKTIDTISRAVYKRFPEVNGKRPKVLRQKPNGIQARPASKALIFLLTYRGNGAGPGGKTIPRYVRVVANQQGKIIKISTSRG